MIKVNGLTVLRGERLVFRHLNFAWDKPELICLTGANGSGKTTLLSLLAGALPFDNGDIHILGHSLRSEHHTAAQQISYVPDDCPIYPFVTGSEWLSFVKSIRIADPFLERRLLSDFGLTPHLNCRFEAMSLGTAKKFILASALMCGTPLLIFDEPTNGLDQTSVEALNHHLMLRKSKDMIIISCLNPHQQTMMAARTVELCSLERP